MSECVCTCSHMPAWVILSAQDFLTNQSVVNKWSIDSIFLGKNSLFFQIP